MSNTVPRGNLTLRFSSARHRCWSLLPNVSCYCTIGSEGCVASVSVEQRAEPCNSLLPNYTETLATQDIGSVSSQFSEFSFLRLVPSFMNRPKQRQKCQAPAKTYYVSSQTVCGSASYKSVLYTSYARWTTRRIIRGNIYLVLRKLVLE